MSSPSDKPTHKITPSALKNSVEAVEKPVIDALYEIMLRLGDEQEDYKVDNGEAPLSRNEFAKYVHKEFNDIKDMLLKLTVNDWKFANQVEQDRKADSVNDTSYYPNIRVRELGATAFFLRHAKEIKDQNLQITDDDKQELLNNGKIALEEIANISKQHGWGEMDVPELKFKDPLRVVAPSNDKSI